MKRPSIFVQLPAPDWHFPEDNRNKAKAPDAIDIINLICVYFKTSFQQITKRGRYRKDVMPRQIAMLMIRKHTGMTLQATGAFFEGAKDHTTVIHSINTINDLIQTDSQLAEDVNTIDYQIQTQLK